MTATCAAGCGTELHEDTIVTQLESADVFCADCGEQLTALIGSEEVYKSRVPYSEIHEDWK